MKHIYFIFNPQAGKAEMTAYLGFTIDKMTKAGYEVTVHPTQGKLDAMHMAAKAADSGIIGQESGALTGWQWLAQKSG